MLKRTYSGTIAIILNFFAAAGAMLASIYSNTLFLSSYPATWLVYFLIIQAIISSLSSFILTPFLTANIKHNSIVLLNITAALIVGIFYCIKIHYFWLPFIIAIFIGLVSSILIVIGWNIITLAFNIREYKHIVSHVNQAAIIGAIMGGLQSSLLLHYFSLHFLLLPLVICLLGSSVMTYCLPLIVDSQSLGEEQQKHPAASPFQFALYRNTLYFSVVLIATQAFIEYVFKFQIAQHFTAQNIGIFIGYFMSFTNILGFLVSLTINTRFLETFRLDGLLYVTPIFTLLACIGALWVPGFWSICILASIKGLFYYNHSRLGMEISINILPSASRFNGKSQFKYIFSPLASIASFLILLIMTQFTNVRGIVLITALLCFVCFYFVKKITQSYKNTLQQETEFRRFNLIKATNPATEKFFKDTIMDKLKRTQDPDSILYYFNLLRKLKDVTPTIALYKQLNNPNALIRRSVIKFITRNKSRDSLNYLLQQFKTETDAELKCFLFDAIKLFNFDKALEIAQQYKHDINNPIYPHILGIFFYLNPTDRDYALSELRKLVDHPNPFIRKETAYLMGHYGITELTPELGLLISDPDPHVCEMAIKVAAHTQVITFAPAIIKHLVPGLCARAAKLALVELGSDVIPIILQHMVDNDEHKILLIQVIARIPGIDSEQALLKMFKEENIYWQTLIAKESNRRACYQIVSDEFKFQAKQFALKECYTVKYLENLATLYSSSYIVIEIAARIQLAKSRALHWAGVAFDPVMMGKLMPSLLNSKKSATYQTVQLTALELLEIIINDVTLKRKIIGLFEQKDEDNNFEIPDYIYKDDWLERVIKLETLSEEKDKMDLLLKVFDLRAIDLFKEVPSEILLNIAEETQEKYFNEGETIFQENDFPDGLYCISSGKVKIIRQGKLLNTLSTHDFFGELALIDDSVRSASAVADSDCTLLFMEKSTFERITDDLPEVLRGVTKTLLYYLRQHML